MKTESYTVKCYYRESGIQCDSGKLFHANGDPVLLEGTSVYCPACDGKGLCLTDTGRDFLKFLTKFARPFMRDVMDELFEEREQR